MSTTSHGSALTPRATLRSIAREAGVSHTTVSLVVNGRGDELGIHPDTQQRVREIARRLNYQRNPMAQALRGSRTQTIGVLWSLGGPHHSEGMARLIASGAQRRSYVTYLADHLGDRDITRRALINLKHRGVDAVVVEASPAIAQSPVVVECLEAFDAALIVTSQRHTSPVDQVVLDRCHAIRQVARHFARTGRRRPAFVSSMSGDGKFEAFRDELTQCGCDPENVAFLQAEAKSDALIAEDWTRPLERVFKTRGIKHVPDAILTTSDETATFLLEALRRHGLNVPEDVALVGFNNSIMSQATSPRLASVERFNHALADHIESLLFSRLDGQADAPRIQIVNMQFVWRESAGGPPPEDAAEHSVKSMDNTRNPI